MRINFKSVIIRCNFSDRTADSFYFLHFGAFSFCLLFTWLVLSNASHQEHIQYGDLEN